MNTTMKKMFTTIVGAVILLCLIPSIDVQAASKKLKNKTVYMQTYDYVLEVENITSIKNLKSSNRNVLAPQSCHVWKKSYQDTWFDGNGLGTSDSPANDNVGYMYFAAKKPGKSTISFKAGSKKYTQKVTVKKYVNPLSSLTISNVNDGADISGSLGSSNIVTMETSASDTVKLTAKAADGWQITEIEFSNMITNDTDISDNIAIGRYTVPRSLASVTIGDYNSSSYSFADITLRNKKDKGEIKVTVTLKPSR